jgi:hypothetical protein
VERKGDAVQRAEYRQPRNIVESLIILLNVEIHLWELLKDILQQSGYTETIELTTNPPCLVEVTIVVPEPVH